MRVFGELRFYISITCLIFFLQFSLTAAKDDKIQGERESVNTPSESNVSSTQGQLEIDQSEADASIDEADKHDKDKTVLTDDLETTKGEAKQYFTAFLNQRPPPVRTYEFDQKLDHLNPDDDRKWIQRAYQIDNVNDTNDSPVLLKVGGFKEIGPEAVEDLSLIILARKLKAPIYVLEQRYHGRSVPTDLSIQNLKKFCSSEQALLDIDYFISQSTRSKRKWIVFGVGYGGTLAAWFRSKYPNAARASLVYNAQLQALPENKETYEVFQKGLNKEVKEEYQLAFDEFRGHINDAKYEELQTKFNMCTRLDEGKTVDNVNFMFWSILAYLKEGIKSNYSRTTFTMISGLKTNALDRLAIVVENLLKENNEKCLSVDYGAAIQKYKNINTKYNNEIDYSKALKFGIGTRAHLFQRCSQYGMFETSDGEHSFGHSIPLDFFIRICSEAFDKPFDSQTYRAALDTMNMQYGGQDIKATNLIYITEKAWERSELAAPESEGIIVIKFDGSQTSDMKSSYDSIINHLVEWTKVNAEEKSGAEESTTS